jgi:hypothetical protein
MDTFDYWFYNIQKVRQPIRTHKREIRLGWDARSEIEVKSTQKLTDIRTKLDREELDVLNSLLSKYELKQYKL